MIFATKEYSTVIQSFRNTEHKGHLTTKTIQQLYTVHQKQKTLVKPENNNSH